MLGTATVNQGQSIISSRPQPNSSTLSGPPRLIVPFKRKLTAAGSTQPGGGFLTLEVPRVDEVVGGIACQMLVGEISC